MATVTEIAPTALEQEKDLYKLEERMHFLLYQIAECDRILRQAREMEEKLEGLRQELARLAKEYVTLEE
jgi:hypothetical protein